MIRVQQIITVLLLSFVVAAICQAEIQIDGYFIAQDECPAYQSKNKKTNPGNIHLTTNMAYEVLSKNKVNATHYPVMSGIYFVLGQSKCHSLQDNDRRGFTPRALGIHKLW